MSIGTAFSYTRASIQTVRWMSRTLKTSCGKSIQTMTTAATASVTSFTGIISMHMGRSSRRTGPTLIPLRGTLGGLQSASLTTLGPVDRLKFSKSTASRLRYYRADSRDRLLAQSSTPSLLTIQSDQEAVMNTTFETALAPDGPLDDT